MQIANSELGSKPAANPRRVAAGKRNRAKRKGLSPAGRERLRDAARRNRPWLYATGPRTAAGKARAAANGKTRQQGLLSARELTADLRALRAMLRDMADVREATGRAGGA